MADYQGNNYGGQPQLHCPQCGAPFTAGAAFCRNCGGPLPKIQPQGTAYQSTAGGNSGAGTQAGPVHCPNCGNILQPGMKFCRNCGAPTPERIANASADQNAGAAGAQGSYQNGSGNIPQGSYQNGAGNIPQGRYPNGPGYAPQGESGQGPHYGGSLHLSRAGQEIVSMAGGPIMLIFTILATLTVVFSLAANFSLSTVLGNAPMIVILIGLWMCYVMLRSNPQSTTGITLIRGGLIAQMVILLIALVIVVIAGVIVTAMSGNSSVRMAGASGTLAVMGIVILIIGAAAIVLLIFYYRTLLGMLKGIRNVLQGVSRSFPSGILPAVMIVISIILNVIGIIATAVLAGSMSSILSGLSYSMGISSSQLSSILGRSLSGSTALSVFTALVQIAASVLGLMLYQKAKGISEKTGGGR